MGLFVQFDHTRQHQSAAQKGKRNFSGDHRRYHSSNHCLLFATTTTIPTSSAHRPFSAPQPPPPPKSQCRLHRPPPILRRPATTTAIPTASQSTTAPLFSPLLCINRGRCHPNQTPARRIRPIPSSPGITFSFSQMGSSNSSISSGKKESKLNSTS